MAYQHQNIAAVVYVVAMPSPPSSNDGTVAIEGKLVADDVHELSKSATAITVEKPGSTSIYQLWSRRKRATILAVVSVSQFLNPFNSSIILPSLTVRAEMHLPGHWVVSMAASLHGTPQQQQGDWHVANLSLHSLTVTRRVYCELKSIRRGVLLILECNLGRS